MGHQADAALFERIAHWKAAYIDETTGVRTIIEDLLWDHAAFRTAINCVRLSAQRDRRERVEDDRQRPNQLLFDLLAKGYWASLLLGARKLLDPYPLTGRRGVYSLRSILVDVRACRSKLTRRVYVERLRGCRYDLEALRRENRSALEAAGGKPIWGDLALTLSEFAHADFDHLSGVAESDRGEKDVIDPHVLDLIEARLKQLDAISDHASTHIAHAGNVESRVGKGLDAFDIRDARALIKALKEVGDLVGVRFCNEGISTLAVYQGDQFEGLDLPMVSSADMDDLANNWNVIDRDISSWSLTIDDLRSGATSTGGIEPTP